METENMISNSAIGRFPIPREHDWEEPLDKLFQAAKLDSYGFPEKDGVDENDVFVIRPYYWGDCHCGFEERENAWHDQNHHQEDCFQSEVKRRISAIRNKLDKMEIGEQLDIKDSIYSQVAIERGLDPEYGVMVHCDCDHKDRLKDFLSTNGHADDCRIVLPNFHHKPTGFTIEWYKYPLRGSYMNMDISLKEYRDIMTSCCDSIK